MHPNIYFTTAFKLHKFSLWNGKMAEKLENYQIIMVFFHYFEKNICHWKFKKRKKDRGKYPL